jgi:hypothetical protein
MKPTYVCPQVNLKIGEIDFEADLVILTSSGIDVILGMDWLGKHDGIILCAKKSVLLTSPKRDKIEFVATATQRRRKSKSRSVDVIQEVCEYLNTFSRSSCTRISSVVFQSLRISGRDSL